MLVREATAAERAAYAAMPGVWVDLDKAVVLVAEEDGAVAGYLCGQLVWHVEHLVVVGDSRMRKARAAVRLYRAMERVIAQSSFRQMFCFTRRKAVKGWADRLGWTRAYKGAAMFTKFF